MAQIDTQPVNWKDYWFNLDGYGAVQFLALTVFAIFVGAGVGIVCS